MKKIRLPFTFILLFAITTLPTLLFARSCPSGVICNPISSSTFAEFVDKILKVVIQIGYVVVVFFIVYCGFLFVKARGNESELATAKTAFLWTVVGAAIILGAQVLENAIAKTIEDISK